MFTSYWTHNDLILGVRPVQWGDGIQVVAVRRVQTGGRPRYTPTRVRTLPTKANPLNKPPAPTAVRALTKILED
jgi:hypothetical protein